MSLKNTPPSPIMRQKFEHAVDATKAISWLYDKRDDDIYNNEVSEALEEMLEKNAGLYRSSHDDFDDWYYETLEALEHVDEHPLVMMGQALDNATNEMSDVLDMACDSIEKQHDLLKERCDALHSIRQELVRRLSAI